MKVHYVQVDPSVKPNFAKFFYLSKGYVTGRVFLKLHLRDPSDNDHKM